MYTYIYMYISQLIKLTAIPALPAKLSYKYPRRKKYE